jgi:putative membrane protein
MPVLCIATITTGNHVFDNFIPVPFRHNQPFRMMVAWLVIYWLLMSITPLHRFEWMLENILILFYTVLLVATYKKFQFSNISYFLFTIFMTLHITGAHFTYAEVPLGYWMQDWFGLQRNNYDRVVHFSYGLLIALPFFEVLLRAAKMDIRWAYFITVNIILAFSAFFEIIETLIVIFVRPDVGAAYLGMQGDPWDAQWDMGLAMLGAISTMVLAWAYNKSR